MTEQIALPEGLSRVDDCHLVLADDGWAYPTTHAAEIAANWQRRQAENPTFFNGRVLMTTAARIVDGTLVGRCCIVDFATFLHWREQDVPDPGAVDAFGSALIVSSDGGLMLARQREGNLNSGLVYPPGGLMDVRDIGPDERIEVAASIRREIAEETGLTVSDLVRVPGYLVSVHGAQVAIGGVFRSPLTAADLQARMNAGLIEDPERELTEIIIVFSMADAEPLPMPAWTRRLVAGLFEAAQR